MSAVDSRSASEHTDYLVALVDALLVEGADAISDHLRGMAQAAVDAYRAVAS